MFAIKKSKYKALVSLIWFTFFFFKSVKSSVYEENKIVNYVNPFKTFTMNIHRKDLEEDKCKYCSGTSSVICCSNKYTVNSDLTCIGDCLKNCVNCKTLRFKNSSNNSDDKLKSCCLKNQCEFSGCLKKNFSLKNSEKLRFMKNKLFCTNCGTHNSFKLKKASKLFKKKQSEHNNLNKTIEILTNQLDSEEESEHFSEKSLEFNETNLNEEMNNNKSSENFYVFNPIFQLFPDLTFKRKDYNELNHHPKGQLYFGLNKIQKEPKINVNETKKAFLNRELYLGLTLNENLNSSINKFVENAFSEESPRNEFNYLTNKNEYEKFNWDIWEENMRKSNINILKSKIEKFVSASLKDNDCTKIFEGNEDETDIEYERESFCNTDLNQNLNSEKKSNIKLIIREIENMEEDDLYEDNFDKKINNKQESKNSTLDHELRSLLIDEFKRLIE